MDNIISKTLWAFLSRTKHLRKFHFHYILVYQSFYQLNVYTWVNIATTIMCLNATNHYDECGVVKVSPRFVCFRAGGGERPRAPSHCHHADGHRRVSRLPRHQPLHLLLLPRSAERPQHHPQKPLPQPLHRRAHLPCGHQYDGTKGTKEITPRGVLTFWNGLICCD